ncbi:hypothetical protein TYRP_020245 [Tyrophagus putrescentiae]|nr:hypothetical protein TYRP_020245 [Tyrophagus putrescentiae]
MIPAAKSVVLNFHWLSFFFFLFFDLYIDFVLFIKLQRLQCLLQNVRAKISASNSGHHQRSDLLSF